MAVEVHDVNPLYLPDHWPHGRSPAYFDVRSDGCGGWCAEAELWVPADEPALCGDSSLGQLWWTTVPCGTDVVLAMQTAIREARTLERERDGIVYSSPVLYERMRAREAQPLPAEREENTR